MKNSILILVVLLSSRAFAFGNEGQAYAVGAHDDRHTILYFNAQIEQELKRVFAVDSAVYEDIAPDSISDRARNLYSLFVGTLHETLRATLTQDRQSVELTCLVESQSVLKFHRKIALYKNYCTFVGPAELSSKLAAKLSPTVTIFTLTTVSLDGVSTGGAGQNAAELYTELQIGSALRAQLHADHIEMTSANLAGPQQDVQAKVEVGGDEATMSCRVGHSTDDDEYTFYDEFCWWTYRANSKLNFEHAFGIYGRTFKLEDF